MPTRCSHSKIAINKVFLALLLLTILGYSLFAIVEVCGREERDEESFQLLEFSQKIPLVKHWREIFKEELQKGRLEVSLSPAGGFSSEVQDVSLAHPKIMVDSECCTRLAKSYLGQVAEIAKHQPDFLRHADVFAVFCSKSSERAIFDHKSLLANKIIHCQFQYAFRKFTALHDESLIYTATGLFSLDERIPDADFYLPALLVLQMFPNQYDPKDVLSAYYAKKAGRSVDRFLFPAKFEKMQEISHIFSWIKTAEPSAK